MSSLALSGGAASEPLLQAENLRRRFGPRLVLAVDRLEFAPGTVYAVIGPSGAGKTTLLRILALLDTPSEGRLLFQGSEIPAGGKARLAVQRRITLVSQHTLLFENTVAANVAYGLKVRGRRPAPGQIEAALAQVHLSGFGQRRAHSLSGGEQQRVALARAAILTPDLLLLDEPTANLDPANVAVSEEQILRLAEQGSSVVIVTHNLFQARRLARHVLFLHEGTLVETGPAVQVFERPADPRTRAFLEGRMVY